MPAEFGPYETAEQEAAQRVLQAYGKVTPRQFLALVSLWTGISTVTGIYPEPVDYTAWTRWMRRAKAAPGSSEGPPDRPEWKPRAQFQPIWAVCRKGSRWEVASSSQMPTWFGLIDSCAASDGAIASGEVSRLAALRALGLLYDPEETRPGIRLFSEDKMDEQTHG
jgi:hypothetical protein